MNRRTLLGALLGVTATVPMIKLFAADTDHPEGKAVGNSSVKKIEKTTAEWRKELTPEEFNVLREGGTERPGSSPLLHEKAKGTFVCAGCALPLFQSDWKFDSGTGWPSFYNYIDGHLEFKRDYALVLPRTEYHCARCGGHQGHVFNDGPQPTGKRYCNDGVALKFKPG